MVAITIFGGAYLSANATASPFVGSQGGTGFATTTAGNIGNCMKVSTNSPISYTFGTCGGGGGGATNGQTFEINSQLVIMATTSPATAWAFGVTGPVYASSTLLINGLETNTARGTSSFSGGISILGGLNVGSTTATSTFANGLLLSSGCYAMPNGTCVLSATSSFFATSTWNGTVVSGNTNQLAFYATNGQTVSGLSTSTWNGTVASGLTGQIAFYNSSNQTVTGTSTGPFLSDFLHATNTVATSSFDGTVWIGKTSPRAYLRVGTTSPSYTDYPTYGLDIVSQGYNDFFAANITNSSLAPCATAEFTTNNSASSVNIGYGDFGFTGVSFTGSGCANTAYTGFQPSSTFLYNASGAGNLYLGNASTSPTSVMQFFMGGLTASNVVMTLTELGNLGIGTTTPYGSLDIASTTPQLTLTNTGAGLNAKQLFISNDNGIFRFASTSDVYNSAASTTAIFIDPRGAPRLAIGTTSAIGILSIHLNPPQNIFNIFVIASSTLSSTSTLFSIDRTGHIQTGGDAPLLSSCGTNPSVIGNDQHGEVTVGSVAATACTITFAHAYPSAPACTITNQSMSVVNAMTYTISGSAIVVSQTGLTSAKLDYICFGNGN